VRRGGDTVAVQMKGGLLGHWAIWTQRAVELFRLLQRAAKEEQISKSLLGLDSIVTDCNRAIYDSQNDFKGCIPGCHEVLKRQGIFEGTWCLDPNERLSPGQAELIEQVYKDYPEMNDDLFVKQNLSRWFS
jgi:hypothetical protein